MPVNCLKGALVKIISEIPCSCYYRFDMFGQIQRLKLMDHRGWVWGKQYFITRSLGKRKKAGLPYSRTTELHCLELIRFGGWRKTWWEELLSPVLSLGIRVPAVSSTFVVWILGVECSRERRQRNHRLPFWNPRPLTIAKPEIFLV